MHLVPNLVILFSFVSPIPSPRLFPLNNALSKMPSNDAFDRENNFHVVLGFLSFVTCILVRACSFRFPFVCTSMLQLVAF